MNDIEKLIEYIKDHSNNYLGSKATLKEIEIFEYMYDLLIGTLEKQLNGGWIPVDENPPLTIEELKQMNYQPIWIQNINSEIGLDGWGIFRATQVKQIANCQCEANISYYMKDYGRKWLAYRRKSN
jgi:hypothetical protein